MVHGHAQTVEVQIIYAGADFRLRVWDDTIGIDPDILAARSAPGRWGLQGMTERANKVGGRLDLWSRAGAGLELELTVPAGIAYRQLPDQRPWLKRLRDALSSAWTLAGRHQLHPPTR